MFTETKKGKENKFNSVIKKQESIEISEESLKKEVTTSIDNFKNQDKKVEEIERNADLNNDSLVKEVKEEIHLKESLQKINSEAESLKNDVLTELNAEEPIIEETTTVEKIEKEILSIIKIVKPDSLPLDEYEQQVVQDLFDSVKKQQIARGVLLENPEKTIQEVKDLLNLRLKSVLEDARNYNLKTKPDEELVKKAKIALLFEGDTSDADKSSYLSEGKIPNICDLKNYIAGYGEKNKLTESDIDSLMLTKYRKSLTSVMNGQMYYIGNYRTLDKIPKSLMIGLVQAEEENPSYNHYYPIKGGLETAETGKYDNDVLGQLLASDYTRLCLENVDKFNGKPIEKILKSGDSRGDRDPLEYLKKLDLSKEDFDKYLDIIIKHNICYELRGNFGRFYDKEREVVSVYQDTIEKLHNIEMDVNYKNDSQNAIEIKDAIEKGYIGLALATTVCRNYIKKYAEDDYENFKKEISKYDQEHLVFEYLKDEDKIEYAHKLIKQGEEYQIVKLHKLFKEHSLSSEIFSKIKSKDLVYSLKGDLSQFKELSQEEVLGFIDRERVNIFIDNIKSFNISNEFLKDKKVQEACFAEFNKEIMTFYPEKARIISEKIPFNKEELDQAILKAVKYKWLEADGGRSDWARAIIRQFPEIKKYLDNKEDKERAFEDLKKVLNNGYVVYIADILECLPLDKELLKSEEVKTLCLESIQKSSPRFGDILKDNIEKIDNYFKIIERISRHIELPEYLLKDEISFERLKPAISSIFLRDIKFDSIYNRFRTSSPEEQNQILKIININSNKFSGVFDENHYAENTIAYINDAESLAMLHLDEDRKSKVLEMFNGKYKDVALKMVSKEWQSFLNTDSKFLPPNIYFISRLIDNAGGAGNLKHLESLGNLIYQVNNILENPKTVERTKEEIKDLLFKQEIKFDKEKLSQDDRSEFYNLSNDILKASPSLYSAFSPIFEFMSPKDMKIFIKDIFPFYQAQLTIIQEIGNNDEIKYNPRELVSVRESLKDIKEKIQNNSEDIKNIFDYEKSRLIEVVKDGFKNRFGLIKVPLEFSKENLRSIQNGIRYISNINERNAEKEVIITFYLGLEINNEWDAFRQGKKINLEEYFSGKQLDIIKPLVEEKNKSYELLSEVAGISKEQMSQFQEILQDDTISNIIGNIQTVDVKLGDIKRNILELTDPDIYENQIDKDIIKLLSENGKLIGSVLAKTYSEVSGKIIPMNDEEKALQSKIASIFDIESWDTNKVKQIQGNIQPLSLVSNMINKMNEEKVDENIQELQKRLMPSSRIIEIFNRLGEEFKQESGAIALSKDLAYLESLIVKDDKKITQEEKEEISTYIDSIKDKMKDLEVTLDKVREYFNKLKKSAHLENNILLKNRLADIEKIIYSTDSSAMIVSHMTKDLNLIIENMRQCLGCMRKEINNDTNLAFGDYNKFFMMNQGEKERGSISDEIVFFVPIKSLNREEEMSFVLDRVYGSKSSDVLVGNILSVYKKYQALKKNSPSAKISISISDEAMSSVGLNSVILKKKLSEILKDNIHMEEFAELSVNIPKSAFSDNYVEFGKNASARQSGERQFSGLILK